MLDSQHYVAPGHARDHQHPPLTMLNKLGVFFVIRTGLGVSYHEHTLKALDSLLTLARDPRRVGSEESCHTRMGVVAYEFVRRD